MAAILLALIAVVLVNLALVIYLAKRGRREAREDERALAEDAAKRALERGFSVVRGEAWMRAHSRSRR